MYILHRYLPTFGMDLVWDGKKVMACRMHGRQSYLIEEHEATTLATATEIMRDLEGLYHACCVAMT